MNRLKIVIFILSVIVVSFLGGYFASEYKYLKLEFDLSGTNSIADTLSVRAPMYVLAKQGQHQRLEVLLESLLFGDLLAVSLSDSLSFHNLDLICSQLLLLKEASSESKNHAFLQELKAALVKCKQK